MLVDEIAYIVRLVAGGHDFVGSGLGIWAKRPFSEESAARQGHCMWRNGGILDDKEFCISAERVQILAMDWTRGDLDFMQEFAQDVAREIIRVVQEEEKWRDEE